MTARRFVCRYPDQRALTTAFGIGYLSRLGGDGLGSIPTADIGALGYLLWPVTGATGEIQSFIAFLLALDPTPRILFGLVITAVGVGLWLYRGLPGIKDLWRAYRCDTADLVHEE